MDSGDLLEAAEALRDAQHGSRCWRAAPALRAIRPCAGPWYNERFAAYAVAEPNAGHRALAELEHIIPRFFLATQNVDGRDRRNNDDRGGPSTSSG
jgi:hypothetical protein